MMPLMSQSDIDYLLHFSKKDRKTGNLSKSLYFYKYSDFYDFNRPPRYNIYFNEKPKEFPKEFVVGAVHDKVTEDFETSLVGPGSA